VGKEETFTKKCTAGNSRGMRLSELVRIVEIANNLKDCNAFIKNITKKSPKRKFNNIESNNLLSLMDYIQFGNETEVSVESYGKEKKEVILDALNVIVSNITIDIF